MRVKVFKDEAGRTWVIRKIGSTLSVEGPKKEGEKLCDIARSCAYALKVTQISNIPLAYINEHQRIWNCIWKLGDTPDNG
ncbi:MAG: hypothetical protein WC370_04855 [Dehalococcoidales bacterium]|jgi:hypothetical protein